MSAPYGLALRRESRRYNQTQDNRKCFKKPDRLTDLFHSLENVALGGDRDAKVVIIISVLQETSIFLVFPRLFGIGNGKEMIFANKPIAQTTVFHN